MRKHGLAFLLFVSFVLCLQTVSGFTTYAGTPGKGVETFKRSDFITVIEHWGNVWWTREELDMFEGPSN